MPAKTKPASKNTARKSNAKTKNARPKPREGTMAHLLGRVSREARENRVARKQRTEELLHEIFGKAARMIAEQIVFTRAAKRARVEKRTAHLTIYEKRMPGFSREQAEEMQNLVGGTSLSSGKSEFLKYLLNLLREEGFRVSSLAGHEWDHKRGERRDYWVIHVGW